MTSHTVYNVPRAMQAAALAALKHGESWIACARKKYEEHRDIAYSSVQAPCMLPDGATYLFLNLSDYCHESERDCVRVLERLVDAGMLLTPGGAFGSQYQKWARMCFTSVEADELKEAIGRLNQVLASCAREL